MYSFYFAWKNNPTIGLFPCPKRITLYGRRLRIVARGSMNSVLVEFEDGQREIVSGNALRKIKQVEHNV